METHTDKHNLQLNTSKGFALYVHLHPAYFGLVIYDHDNQRIEKMDTVIHHQPHLSNSTERSHESEIDSDALQAWIKINEDLLNQPYQTIKVCVSTSMFHILNDEKMATDELFAVMNTYEPGSLDIRTDRIREDLFVQYGLESKLASLLASHFEPGNIHFGERGLLQLLSSESDLFEDGLYCQLLGQEATVVILSGSRLIFFNKYPVKNREDLLYYILLCFQSHDLDSNTDKLFLSGLIEKQSPMYELVFDYVRNVEFMTLPGTIEMTGEQPEGFSLHHYINLLSIR